MKQFTIYKTQINPNASAAKASKKVIRVVKKKRKPTYQIQKKAIMKAINADKVNFKRGQKTKAVAIIDILDFATKKGIKAPNIDEICNVARTYHKKYTPKTLTKRDDFRKIFDILIAAGYVKKVKI